MHEIRDYVEIEVRKNVLLYSSHPHGVGIYQLANPCQRDTLFATNPHMVGNRMFRFVKHDEAPMNAWRSPFTITCWLLLLGYPLDLKDTNIMKQVCGVMGQLLFWNSEDRSLARALVKVMIDNPLDVPRSLVIKHGKELGGVGKSWTVPVYIFNS